MIMPKTTPPTPETGESAFSFAQKSGEPPALAAARKNKADQTFDEYEEPQSGSAGAVRRSATAAPSAMSAPGSASILPGTAPNDKSQQTESKAMSSYAAAIPLELRSNRQMVLMLLTLLALIVLNGASLLWLISNARH